MRISIISTEILSIYILFIIEYGSLFEIKDRTKKNKAFILTTIMLLLVLIVDVTTWMLDGNEKYTKFLWVGNYFSYSLGFLLTAFITVYVYLHISERIVVNIWIVKFMIIACVLSEIMILLLTVNKWLFYIYDGNYVIGKYYEYIKLYPITALLYNLLFIYKYRKVLEPHDTRVMMGFVSLPIVAILIHTIFPIVPLSYAYVACTLSILRMYIMSHAEQEKIHLLKEATLFEKSSTDNLTGLYNRNSYENDIAILNLEHDNEDIAFLSIDVNGLKNINDSLGHAAGDELIIGVGQCMKNYLSCYGKAYRIGGDEFVAILHVNENILKLILEDFNTAINNWSGKYVKSISVSIGYVMKNEMAFSSIRKIVRLADKRMYEAKSEYYKRMGIDRRKIGDKEL